MPTVVAKERIKRKLQRLRTHHRVLSSGIGDWLVLCGCIVIIAGIFAIDILTGTDIRVHVLYVFPLFIIARFCERWWLIPLVFLMTLACETLSYSIEIPSTVSFATDVSIASAAAILIVVLSRQVRQKYLDAINQATTDALTHLANRRAFVSALDLEIARQRRYGGVVSLAVIDLDGFKALNDSRGHHAGDQALKRVADVLREHARRTDVIARLGGDEFAMLMPNTPETECGALCRQRSLEIQRRMLEAGFGITASIGFKTFNSAPATSSTALSEADTAMYKVKRQKQLQAYGASGRR